MKTILKSALFLSMSTLFLACSSGSQQEQHEGHVHEPATAETFTSNTAVSLKDAHLNAVYPHYLQLTSALTEGNVAKAKVAALAIETGAKAMKGADQLASTAAKITSAADLDAQRTVFSDLNNTLISLLKASGTSAGELYVAYCPMALNDEGAYWVTNVKEIRNPYFGDSMLTCGSVKETIQ